MAFDPITAIVGAVDKVLGAVLPDKAAKDASAAKLTEMVVAGEIASIAGQIDVNKAEAASNSVFVAGWRPFIGWVCGAALAFQFLFAPLLTWIAELLNHAVKVPSLDMGDLFTLLLGMLGLGAMRSFDKSKGTDNGH